MLIIPYACTLSNKTYLMKIKPGYIEFKLRKAKMIVRYLQGAQRKLTLPARSSGAWEAAHLLQDKVKITNHLVFPLPENTFVFSFSRFVALVWLSNFLFVCFRFLPYISGLASSCLCSYAQGSEGCFSDILVFFPFMASEILATTCTVVTQAHKLC